MSRELLPQHSWRLETQDAVQALLCVLNDIGGGNPWNYNVITEAAEDALDAALPHLITDQAAERFLAEMNGVFVGTPDAMRKAVKRAMTLALGRERSS